MVQPNWSLLQMNGPQGGFQNALAQGYSLGTDMRQRREEGERRNALAAYGQNPGEETLGGVMQTDPRTGLQLREIEAQRAQQAQSAQQEQMATMRRLLEAAGDNPAQAYQAAQSMGIDVSSIPQPGTPEFEPWRREQLFIMDALENIDEPELTTLQRNVMSALPPEHRDPNSPVFGQAMQRALIDWQVVQQGGRISGQNPVTGAIENLAVPGTGPGGAAPSAQAPQGAARNVSPRDYGRMVESMGPERATQWAQQNNVAVQVASPQEARQLPSGTPILLPDGTVGRVP